MVTGMSALFGLTSIFAAAPAKNAAADGGIMAACMGGIVTILLVGLVLYVFFSVVFMKIFTKADQPGWAAWVPIYNQYILIVEVCKMEILWFILSLIPPIYIVPAIMVPFKLAEKFGKETGFAVGLLLLGIVFYPMLAFGSAEYEGGGKKKYKPKFEDEEEEEEEEEEDEDEDERPRKKRR